MLDQEELISILYFRIYFFIFCVATVYVNKDLEIFHIEMLLVVEVPF